MRQWQAHSDRGPWFQRRPRLALAVSGLLYGAVLVLRFLDDSPADAVTLLFCLPVALLAVTFGLRGGLLAGLVGLALLLLWVAVADVYLSPVGWATRAVPMLLLGALLGDAVDRLRRSDQERRRLDAAAQRHREAVEINDTIVQGLAAAKWALESGRHERGLQVVTETLELSQTLVSDLLRSADMGAKGGRGRSTAATG